ncbi:unnamed protein product [Paramecium sonneborni]|uniref:Tetratricopeptide repeat protein n=1 Tax=Paramecium sonneborni TaxID=65129 RepID=A0A8S1QUC8_9CILI|nr:unnamed protein product [Paramecium sonneborni]CAD8119360.1 unnamed protein product [Paramecium sonneborni]
MMTLKNDAPIIQILKQLQKQLIFNMKNKVAVSNDHFYLLIIQKLQIMNQSSRFIKQNENNQQQLQLQEKLIQIENLIQQTYDECELLIKWFRNLTESIFSPLVKLKMEILDKYQISKGRLDELDLILINNAYFNILTFKDYQKDFKIALEKEANNQISIIKKKNSELYLNQILYSTIRYEDIANSKKEQDKAHSQFPQIILFNYIMERRKILRSNSLFRQSYIIESQKLVSILGNIVDQDIAQNQMTKISNYKIMKKSEEALIYYDKALDLNPSDSCSLDGKATFILFIGCFTTKISYQIIQKQNYRKRIQKLFNYLIRFLLLILSTLMLTQRKGKRID